MTPRRTRVRVFRGPTDAWEWICRIPGSDGKVDLWCTYQMLAFPGGTHDLALTSAVEHHRQHGPNGDLTLTYEAVMRVMAP